jgi:hypothetical protein
MRHKVTSIVILLAIALAGIASLDYFNNSPAGRPNTITDYACHQGLAGACDEAEAADREWEAKREEREAQMRQRRWELMIMPKPKPRKGLRV